MTHTILIVEDDELLRDIYATKFRIEGFRVETAVDGAEGLQKAVEINPDLMLVDNLMPRMSGLELLEQYRARNIDHPTIIMFLSNKSLLPDINYAKKLGAADYLIKSQHTPEDIVRKVKHQLAHSRWSKPA